MKRQLPIYPIDGTNFLVDIDRQELRQVDQPANVISFVKDMTDMGTYYILPYDRAEKNYPYHSYFKQEVIEVAIPSLTVLDPEGMSEKFGCTVDQLKGKDDFDVFVKPELLAERKRGNLPLLWINGHEFVVDVKKNELRPLDGLTSPIPMRIFNFADDGSKYQDYYHTVDRKLVEIDLTMTALPANVMQIRIPNVLFLDPVGVANRFSIDENFLLRRYPIQKQLKAELIPLEQTHLLNLTISNQHYQVQKQYEAQREKQGQSRRSRPKL
jgi:hypothetical protein